MAMHYEHFEQPLEGIFRDGIPAPVLRAFAPLLQAVPNVNRATMASSKCWWWKGNPVKCVDEDVNLVSAYMQTCEGSFRLCPQQSATLLKCHQTEPAKAMWWCREEEWEWRTCLTDKTGIKFWPYSNAPRGAPWSNGGQTEDFHLEDRTHFIEGSTDWMQRQHLATMRAKQLEEQATRKTWNDEKMFAVESTEITVRPPSLSPHVV